MKPIYVKQLEDVAHADLTEVGGKAASLGEMIQAGLPVPQGFVLTTKAYKNFLDKPFSKKLEKEILTYFDVLSIDRVAIRSSAIAEDSQQASWAGQLESYLNITKDELVDAIRKCWNSINSKHALAYAKQKNIPHSKLAIAVIVQKMVNSDASGVLFTQNPVTHNTGEIMIEAGYGLGELLVQGEITPDNYVINKKTLKIKTSSLGSQEVLLSYKNGKNQKIPLPNSLKEKPVLSNRLLQTLLKMAKKIEQQYDNPQDIEWAIENGKIFIVQKRPITTLTDKKNAQLTLAPSITRDWSVIFAEMWVTAYTKTFKEQFDWAYTDVVYESTDGAFTVYRSPAEHLETMRDLILKNLATDPVWFDKQADKLESLVEEFRKWIRFLNSHLHSLDNAKLARAFDFFISQNLSMSPRYVMMLWFPLQMEQHRDKQKYAKVIKRAKTSRKNIHNIGQEIDALARRLASEVTTRSNISPNLAKYLTISEIQSILRGEIVKLKDIAARKKRFVIAKNGIQNISIQEYCVRQKYILSVPQIDIGTQLTGTVAYEGFVQGKVKIVRNRDSFSKVKKGDIIVSPMTTPDYSLVLNKATAIITDEGGITCHAAIIAREMKKPCVIGTQFATQILKDGDLVEVDATTGIIKKV